MGLSSFTEFEEFKSDPIGKSLVETIQMTMEKSGGKVENVRNLLSQLKNKLLNEQKASDNAWAKEKRRLTNLIRSLGLEIASIRADLVNLRQQRVSFIKRRNRAQRNIKQYNSQRVRSQNTLNDLTVRRKQDKSNFQVSKNEHNALIDALGQVISHLARLRKSISGVGKPSHVSSTSSEKRDAAWARSKKALLEVMSEDEMNALVEVATQADQDALLRLLNILTRIQNGTKASLRDQEAHEQASKRTFNKLRTNLNNDVRTLRNVLKAQRKNLNKYNRKINELTVTIKLKNQLLKVRIASRKAAKAEKLQKHNKYHADRKQRHKELKVIRRLTNIVETRLASMSKYLSSNVNK
jgi:hypothetical protein